MRLAIVDYRINNIGSLVRAVQSCGVDPLIVRHGDEIASVDKIIMPGVGTFGDGMQKLAEFGFIDSLKRFALVDRKPILGICLGMQLFAKRGFELGEYEGLDFFDFVVEKLHPEKNERLPHIGWNSIEILKASKLLANVPNNTDFYFVHSYGIKMKNVGSECTASSDYADNFAAVIEENNIFGVQFHPEKSFPLGFEVLKNFLTL